VPRGEEEDSEQMETEPVTEVVLKEMCQTTINDSVLQLDRIRPQLEKDFSDLAFVTGFSSKDKQLILSVTQQEMHHHPSFGHTSRVGLVIKGNEYVVNQCCYAVRMMKKCARCSHLINFALALVGFV